MGDERGVSGDAGEGGVEAREGDGQREGELQLFGGRGGIRVKVRDSCMELERRVSTKVAVVSSDDRGS